MSIGKMNVNLTNIRCKFVLKANLKSSDMIILNYK